LGVEAVDCEVVCCIVNSLTVQFLEAYSRWFSC
jgi:hypothetical protein